MNRLFDGSHRFGRRCTAALTHPVTVGAVGVLLLNDLVFKSLWSNPWTTGKLSDLAWVIFASPLLAFLLSPVARRSSLGERIVFVTAYAGLPVLYAAFNTFPVVHDVILWALSFAGGTGAGAPHDPADSLVIPFGLGIALWVWRHEPAVSNSLRMRFGLLVAGVAALASVASTPPDTVVGVTAVEVAPDGTIVSAGGEYSEGYWTRGDQDTQSVETPRGTYTIEGSYVMRTHNGERTVAYSATYLQERGNIELQTHATRDFGRREITSKPYSLIYDERSGNVVVAMGLQGAVVGTPDDRWTRIAVGKYVPTDFSVVHKLQLLRDWGIWLAMLALTFSFAGLAMTLAESGTYNIARILVVVIGILGVVLMGAFISSVGFVSFVKSLRDPTAVPIVLLSLALFVALVFVTSTVYYSAEPWRKTDHLIPAILSVTASLGGLIYAGSEVGLIGPLLVVSGASTGLLLALLVIAVSYGDLRWGLSTNASKESTSFVATELCKGLLPAVSGLLAGMLVILYLSFLLWVLMGIDLAAAKLFAVLLLASAAYLLHRILAGMLASGSTRCPCGCGGVIHPASSFRR